MNRLKILLARAATGGAAVLVVAIPFAVPESQVDSAQSLAIALLAIAVTAIINLDPEG